MSNLSSVFAFLTASTAARFLQQRWLMPREQKGDVYLFRHTLRGSLSSCWGGGELYCRLFTADYRAWSLLSAVWTLTVLRLMDSLPYWEWYHSCFGSTYKLPQSLAKHLWSYCCIQMSFQGFIITVRVLGSLLWVTCQYRLLKLQLLGSLQTDDCLSFWVLALACCQIMLFSKSSSSHSKKERNVSQWNSELGLSLWKKELLKCSVSSCWKQGRLELSREECGQCTLPLMLPVASLAAWMWVGASLAFISEDSQTLAASQYRNIVVPLRNLSEGTVRLLCPWLSSKGGVQSFVCLLTAFISITVIEMHFEGMCPVCKAPD